jgi:uncharacterized membrane protein
MNFSIINLSRFEWLTFSLRIIHLIRFVHKFKPSFHFIKPVTPLEGLEIKLNVSGLSPRKRGVHIHQFAICEAPDFKTAGDHLNPEQKKHGMDNPEGNACRGFG